MKKPSSKFAIFLFFIFILPVKAQDTGVASGESPVLEFKKSDYKINYKFTAGSYLIYDCENGYYACVDKDSSNLCKEKRELAMEKGQESYPCAPLKNFSDKKECLLKNYSVLEANALKRFCYPKN